MKRRFQLAALLLIGLLALQPALAAIPCMDAAHSASGAACSMVAMGSHCPMMHETVAALCHQNCCSHAVPQSTPPPAAPERSNTAASSLCSAISLEEIEIPGSAIVSLPPFQIGSPPIYVLNQVFRI